MILSALLLVLGRHGQRVLAGLALLALVVFLSLRFVKPLAPGLPVAGVLMIVGGAVAFALGTLRAEQATAGTLGLLCAFLGARAAVHFGHAPWAWGALCAGVPAFFGALAFHAQLAVVLPPIGAACALTLGLLRLPALRGAKTAIPRIALPWAAALLFLVASLFLAISVARERRRERKRALKTRAMGDRELEKKIARDRERHAAESPAPPDAGGEGPRS